MPPKAKSASPRDSSANLGFEGEGLHDGAFSRSKAALRRLSEARQYKHVVLGLIFLTYISDTFEEHRAKLVAGKGDYAGANTEDQGEPSGGRQTAKSSPKSVRGGANQYKAENAFWVPSKVLLAFDKQVPPLFRQVAANRAQSRTLATLCDTLLSKLLIGELSVANAGQIEGGIA